MIKKDEEKTEADGTSNEIQTESRKDKFGFIPGDRFHQSLLITESELMLRREKEIERTKKWLKMINNWEFTTTRRQAKLKRRIRKGIPDALRMKVWYDLSQAEKIKKKIPKPSTLIVDGTTLDPLTIDDVRIVHSLFISFRFTFHFIFLD